MEREKYKKINKKNIDMHIAKESKKGVNNIVNREKEK